MPVLPFSFPRPNDNALGTLLAFLFGVNATAVQYYVCLLLLESFVSIVGGMTHKGQERSFTRLCCVRANCHQADKKLDVPMDRRRLAEVRACRSQSWWMEHGHVLLLVRTRNDNCVMHCCSYGRQQEYKPPRSFLAYSSDTIIVVVVNSFSGEIIHINTVLLPKEKAKV